MCERAFLLLIIYFCVFVLILFAFAPVSWQMYVKGEANSIPRKELLRIAIISLFVTFLIYVFLG